MLVALSEGATLNNNKSAADTIKNKTNMQQ